MRTPAARVIALLFGLVLPGAGLLLSACGEPPAVEAPTDEAPAERSRRPAEERPRSGRSGTEIRFACDFPGDVTADGPVDAWWAESRGGKQRKAPAVIEDGVVAVYGVPGGAGVVTFFLPGHVVVVRDVRAPRGRIVDGGDVTLVEAVPLRGQIIDTDEHPVRGARVRPMAAPFSVGLARTDEEGRFEIDGLPPGVVVLHAESYGFVTQRVPCRHGPEIAPVQIVMDPGGKVVGTVLEHDGRDLSTDARVWIVDLFAPEDRDRMAWPVLGGTGRHAFETHLAPGRYLIHAQDGSRKASGGVVVEQGGRHEVTLTLPVE